MASYSSDRRSVLKIIGAIGATCAYPYAGDELLGQVTDPHTPPPQRADVTRQFFSEEDFKTISRIAELILPETSTPGAIGAAVPQYIDLLVARNTDNQLLVADGLRWLDGEAHRIGNASFSDLSEADQLMILEPLCEAADAVAADAPDTRTSQARNVQFFAFIKGLTADGYYTSKIGLIDELGYKGNMARPDFPACVHEH